MKKWLFLLILALLLLPVSGWADTHYVNGTLGTDSGAGTSIDAGAWKTIRYALTGFRMNQGDTLEIQSGTYNEAKIATAALGGGSGYTIIQPYGIDTVYIQCNDETTTYCISLGYQAYLKRLHFINGNSLNIPMFYKTVAATNKFEDCTWDNNRAGTNASFYCIGDSDTSINLSFERCSAITNAPFFESSSFGTGANKDTITFKSCLVSGGGSLAKLQQPSDTTITNCTVVNPASGSYFAHIYDANHAGSTLSFKNNIYYTDSSEGNATIGLSIGDALAADFIATPANLVIQYNNFYNAALPCQEYSYLYKSGGAEIIHVDNTNIFCDPGFNDLSGGDYTLASTSYAAGRGTATGLPTYDLNGSAWTAADIGCYANPAKRANPTLDPKIIAMIGTSVYYGVGAETGYTCWDKLAEIIPTYTVIPGTTTAVSGAQVESIRGQVEHAIFDHGAGTILLGSCLGNNILTTTTQNPTNLTDAQLAIEFEAILQRIKDWGATPYWLGSGRMTDGDITRPLAVCALIEAWCAANGVKYDNFSERIMFRSDWSDADVYYAAGQVHPNNSGHMVIATEAENLIMDRPEYHVDDVNGVSTNPATFFQPITTDGINALTTIPTGQTGRTVYGHGCTDTFNTPSAGASGKVMVLKGEWKAGAVLDQQYWEAHHALMNGGDASNNGLTISAANCKAYNVTAVNCSGSGLKVDEDTTVTNCLGWNGVGTDITIANGKTVTGDYNYFQDAAGAGDGTYTDGGHTVWSGASPRFVNPTGGNFHVKFGSPCINAGADLSLTSDIEGTTLPWRTGMAPTIGAYEQPKINLMLNLLGIGG